MKEKGFTIKQAAIQTGITQDTIRYYEKIALLPKAKRKDNGHRFYQQEDIETIHLINCLKKTGMPLEEIKPFLEVNTDADPAEYPELVELLRNHRQTIVSQIDSLQQVVNFIDVKLEQGNYRGKCSTNSNEGTNKTKTEEYKPKSVSSAELNYFTSHSAKKLND